MNGNSKNRQALILCIQWILILVIIFCIIKIAIWVINSMEDSKKNSDLISDVIKIYDRDNSNNDIEIYNDDKNVSSELVIDFDKLTAINSDIIRLDNY